jgi:hypothetical protein
MLAKCANPSCSKPFRYLHEGKLFRLEAGQPKGRSWNQRSEWFWLCDECAINVTLRVGVGEVVRTALPCWRTEANSLQVNKRVTIEFVR